MRLPSCFLHCVSYYSFNSRTPGGVRPGFSWIESKRWQFQFTHPGRGATSASQYGCFRENVSIHAPREGCDISKPLPPLGLSVSIHAPREGCDWARCHGRKPPSTFQFTHPGRGATKEGDRVEMSWSCSFNSRTPGGVRLSINSLISTST